MLALYYYYYACIILLFLFRSLYSTTEKIVFNTDICFQLLKTTTSWQV